MSWKTKAPLAWHLSPVDWRVVVEAWWRLVVYTVQLRFRSYEDLQRSVHLKPGKNPQPSAALEMARRLHLLVGYASRLHWFPMTCLVRTLALKHLLASRGIHSEIRIGAAKAGQAIKAHAWLEVAATPIGEQPESLDRFHLLTSP